MFSSEDVAWIGIQIMYSMWDGDNVALSYK